MISHSTPSGRLAGVISVPFFEWDGLHSASERQAYLERVVASQSNLYPERAARQREKTLSRGVHDLGV